MLQQHCLAGPDQRQAFHVIQCAAPAAFKICCKVVTTAHTGADCLHSPCNQYGDEGGTSDLSMLPACKLWLGLTASISFMHGAGASTVAIKVLLWAAGSAPAPAPTTFPAPSLPDAPSTSASTSSHALGTRQPSHMRPCAQPCPHLIICGRPSTPPQPACLYTLDADCLLNIKTFV